MRVLIAEDDRTSRTLLKTVLEKHGYEVAVARDGTEAWDMLTREDPPPMAILDWMMPGIDGIELCHRLREDPEHFSMYVVLLTSRDRKEDIVRGLDAGADDYVTKPFHERELHARVKAGQRIITLQRALARRVQELQDALDNIRTLRKLLPVCANCKRVRDDEGYWNQVDAYFLRQGSMDVSHGICPDCARELYGDVLPGLQREDRPT